LNFSPVISEYTSKEKATQDITLAWGQEMYITFYFKNLKRRANVEDLICKYIQCNKIHIGQSRQIWEQGTKTSDTVRTNKNAKHILNTQNECKKN
jgi:hypothetical protein